MLCNIFSRTGQSQGLLHKHGHDSFTMSVYNPSSPHSNSFIYQAPGPSMVSDSPVSAENIIFEAFFYGRTKKDFLFITSMEKKKSEDKFICHSSSFSIFTLSSRKAVKRSTSQFPTKNKGFINYVFCRNWAVRILLGPG